VKEFARGGEATVDNLRLRCRGHNQFTAERTFGAAFMKEKRSQAKAAAVGAAKLEHPEPDQDEDDVIRALRTLGYRAEESRRAVELCADMPDASPENRLRRALTYFPTRGRRLEPAAIEGPGVAPPA
jgi:Holliday junction resolvasome RuvABC DNA-binding subunit